MDVNGRKFECEPGYPYQCDFTLSISHEAVMRGESIPAINAAYRHHKHINKQHQPNLCEVKQ